MKHKFLKYGLVIIPIFTALFLFSKVLDYYSQKSKYDSLDNVFLEMNYAEVNSGLLENLPDLSTVFGSSQSFRRPDQIIGLGIDGDLSDNESLQVIVGIEETFIIEYRKLLAKNNYLYITYTYRDKILEGKIEIANSDISLSRAEALYYIDAENESDRHKKDRIESAYWFSSSKGLPSLQLTKKEEILDYLKPYGIDATWLREKSSYVLNDIVLKTWFEKGSQRYSFEHLGNVNIIQSDVLK